ncbi:MAG: class I SAM-dependent methyltransferase [Robiginitomaculum sp.]|nr:class I SAM-dependent methyltransferase [Robiginitomaculum sp.]MDQ7076455.1 class I SAM-dependent methyltransferase [Robiginitomaculum sp.]
MSFYNRHIMPRLVNLACSSGQMKKIRAKTVPLAEGRVLEIGFGSGHNLPFLNPEKIEHYWALEPDEQIRKLAQKRMQDTSLSPEFLGLEAEAIPLEDDSADTVLITFTMCTIPLVEKALGEMRRVLKPGGRLLFAEHGAAPDENVARWQSRIEPVWKRIGGGCHLTRKPLQLLENNGFSLESSESLYVPKAPRFAGFVTSGIAKPR